MEAVLGAEVEVNTVEGLKKRVVIPKGCQHGDKVTLKHEGFYAPQSMTKGSHFIHLKIKIPKELT